jgi:hypothetical protein
VVVAKVVNIKAGRGKKRRKPRRLTPTLLMELIAVHSQCVHDQEGRCPLVIFIKPLAWEINQALGLGNEEDNAFRRIDPMCAAKPLRPGHEELE